MAPKADEKAVRRKKATAEEKPKPDDEKQSKIDAKLEAKRIAAEERINRAMARMIYYYLIAFLGLIYVAFMASVPEPYMDEPFHVKQTQEYCAGNWSVWDEKITTFPGLYLLGAGVAAVVRGLAAIGALPPSAAAGACSFHVLRALNLIPAFFTPWLIHSLLGALHPKTRASDLKANAALISLLPTHFFFHFLYYTDSYSTMAVLLLLLIAPRGDPKASTSELRHLAFLLACALAVGLRQTNAVWVAFAVASNALRMCYTAGVLSPQPPFVPPTDLLAAIAELFTYNARTLLPMLCVAHFIGPILILIAFAAFVYYNGGVVVGDKSNHEPVFHLAQLLYLTAVAAAPITIATALNPFASVKAIRTGFKTWRAHPFAIMLVTGVILYAATTVRSHPFLLSDNRHVTFYVWRHILSKQMQGLDVPIVLVPFFLCLGGLIYPSLHQAQGPLIAFGLLLCSALVLVPSPLIEPRYYNLPAMLIWLHAPPLKGAKKWLAPLFTFLFVNGAMIFLFLFRPYPWVDGTTARLMW